MKSIKNLVVNNKKILATYLALRARAAVDETTIVVPRYQYTATVHSSEEKTENDELDFGDLGSVEMPGIMEFTGYSVIEPTKTVMGTLSGKIVRFIDKHIIPKIFDDIPTDDNSKVAPSK